MEGFPGSDAVISLGSKILPSFQTYTNIKEEECNETNAVDFIYQFGSAEHGRNTYSLRRHTHHGADHGSVGGGHP